MRPNELRTVAYDKQLQLEAYRFAGIVQPFPNHFHAHYVLGLVEQGQRTLCCKNREHHLCPGDLLLFNPGDSHGCTQTDGGTFAYRAFNIPQNTMLAFAEELTGSRVLPSFAQNVLRDDALADCLRTLHELVLRGDAGFQKEELLFYLFSTLLERCGQPSAHSTPACPQEVEAVCAFIRQHYAEHLTLEHLCRCAGLSKSTLLRAFVQAKGVTPYRYLEAVRIQKAQQFLFWNSALRPEKEGEQAHREPAFASVRHKKAAAHIILCSSFFILITFRSARMKGIVFCQQVNAVLVHADSLLPGMFCQCTMQATRHPQLELPGIFFQTVRLVNFNAVLQCSLQPSLFCIQCIFYRSFHRFTTGNTARQIRIRYHEAAFLTVLYNFHLIWHCKIFIQRFHRFSPHSLRFVLPSLHKLF